MIEVYRSSDYIEGQLLKGLMEQEGMQVFLTGTALQEDWVKFPSWVISLFPSTRLITRGPGNH